MENDKLKDLFLRVDEQFEKALTTLSGKDLSEEKILRNAQYSVFYSNPFKTLSEGDIYYLGLNPKDDGAKENKKEGLNYFIEEIGKNPDWSGLRLYWGKSGEALRSRIVLVLEKVLSLMNLRLDVKDIFCTNLYFWGYKNANIFKKYKLFDCWEYHKEFLDLVKPQLIVCNGVGNDNSAFSRFEKAFRPYIESEKKPFGNLNSQFHIYGNYSLKWFFIKDAPWGRKRVLVLGIPHLSYFKSPKRIFPEIEKLIWMLMRNNGS